MNQLQIKRLKSTYPFLFPMDYKDKLQVCFDSIQEVHPYMLIKSNTDYLKPALLASVLKLGKYKCNVFCSAYYLIDIYLGTVEEFPSINSFDPPLTIMYFGWDEMVNKQQVPLIKQFIQNQVLRKSPVWFYLKGAGPCQDEIQQFLTSVGFKTVQIKEPTTRVQTQKYKPSYDEF